LVESFSTLSGDQCLPCIDIFTQSGLSALIKLDIEAHTFIGASVHRTHQGYIAQVITTEIFSNISS